MDLTINLIPGYLEFLPRSPRAARWLKRWLPDMQFGARWIVDNSDARGVLQWMKADGLTTPL